MSLLSEIAIAIKTKLGGTSINNTIPRYDGTACKLKKSDVTISDANVVTAGGGFVGNLTGTASNATLAASATKLATERTINGVAFDGTANITIADSTAVNLTGNQTIAGVKTFNNDIIGKSSVEAGQGSGSVALTINDGVGNANVAFNHKNGVPDSNGSSARIRSDVDEATGWLGFEVGSNSVAGVPRTLTRILTLDESSAVFTVPVIVPTPVSTDNSTKVATTAFVKSLIETGSFIKPKSRRGRTLFIKTAPAEITIPKGFKVVMDGFSANLEDDIVISLDTDLDTGTKEAGRDYLVYMTQEGNFYFKLFVGTFDSSDLLIGGLHYGLTPENATLPASTPNKTEADMVANRGIKAYSMWDLTHRPTANPFGKVLVANKFWRNIYPVDEEYAIRGYSSCYKIGRSTIAKIAAGAETNGRKFPKIPTMYGGNETANYGRLSYFTACELNSACGMRNPNYSEFSESSYGVKEEKSASELGYETRTGNIKHFPMLESKWGVEQATGVQWTWSTDLMNGYGSTTFANRLNQTEGRGYMYATENSPVSALFGGHEDHTSTIPGGSRALGLHYYVWDSNWSVGVVGVCDHLNLDTVSENEL